MLLGDLVLQTTLLLVIPVLKLSLEPFLARPPMYWICEDVIGMGLDHDQLV